MKPKKFVASTTRAALTKVREALGDDAVILSNRSTAQGVEVRAIAERDFESLVGTDTVDAIALEPLDGVSAQPIAASTSLNRGVEAGVAQAPTATHSRSDHGADSVYTPAYWSAESEAAKPFRFVDYVRNKLAVRANAPVTAPANAGPLATAGVHAPDKGVAAHLEASMQPPGGVTRPAQAARSVLVREHATPAPVQKDAKQGDGAGGIQREARGAIERTQPASPASMSAAPLADSRPILDELRALRDFMAERFDQLAANADGGVQLVEAMLRRDLLNAGFQPMIVRAALEALPPEFAPAQARDWVEARLTRSLACSTDDIVDTGGVFALTGATGVGKTTTAAKLAARCAVRYGADSVGLITTDTYRIGAPDQLRIYGKILSVPVHTVHDLQWLQRTLETLAGRRLVIIDTMGMGQRDARVSAQLEMLDRCQVKRLLLLAASSQSETQEEVIDLYQGRTGAGAILTKIDETVKLAPALGVLLRYRLKLRYVTNGQRVPEDLQPADAVALMRAALKPPARGAHTERSVERTPHAAAGR